MSRLKPLKSDPELYDVMITTSVSKSLAEKLDAEQTRIGARSRSELCRLIFEQYFEQEIGE